MLNNSSERSEESAELSRTPSENTSTVAFQILHDVQDDTIYFDLPFYLLEDLMNNV